MPKKRDVSKKRPATPTLAQTEAVSHTTVVESPAEFEEILHLIVAARARAFAAVNTALIELYWQIGAQISRRVAADD